MLSDKGGLPSVWCCRTLRLCKAAGHRVSAYEQRVREWLRRTRGPPVGIWGVYEHNTIRVRSRYRVAIMSPLKLRRLSACATALRLDYLSSLAGDVVTATVVLLHKIRRQISPQYISIDRFGARDLDCWGSDASSATNLKS